NLKIEDYSQSLVDLALGVYDRIEHREADGLVMTERRMTLSYRTPNVQLLEWARRVVKEMGDRLPKNSTEVYAREQIFLHERQRTEVVVQAIRLGDVGIATTPCETYALTGLKIK